MSVEPEGHRAFCVYVLANGAGRFYVGQTADIKERLAQHNSGEVRWTSSRGPWSLVYTEYFPNRAAAMAREKALKSGRASQELKTKLRAVANGRASPSGKD
jgi:putative endonuclease